MFAIDEKKAIPKLMCAYNVFLKDSKNDSAMNMLFVVEKDIKTKKLSLKMRTRFEDSGNKTEYGLKVVYETIDAYKKAIEKQAKELTKDIPLIDRIEKAFEIEFKSEKMEDIMKEMQESQAFNVEVVGKKNKDTKKLEFDEKKLSNFLERGREGKISEKENQEKWNTVINDIEESELIKKYGKKNINEIKKKMAIAKVKKDIPLDDNNNKMDMDKEKWSGYAGKSNTRKMTDKEFEKACMQFKELVQGDSPKGLAWLLNVGVKVTEEDKEKIAEKMKVKGADSVTATKGFMIIRNLNPMVVLRLLCETLDLSVDQAIDLLKASKVMGGDYERQEL